MGPLQRLRFNSIMKPLIKEDNGVKDDMILIRKTQVNADDHNKNGFINDKTVITRDCPVDCYLLGSQKHAKSCHHSKGSSYHVVSSLASSETSDDELTKKYNNCHRHRKHTHRKRHYHRCCESDSSDEKNSSGRRSDSSPGVTNVDLVCSNVKKEQSKESECKPVSNKNVLVVNTVENQEKCKKFKSTVSTSLKVQATIIIQTVYRAYKAKKLYKKLLQDKLDLQEKELKLLKQKEIEEQLKKKLEEEKKVEFEDRFKSVNQTPFAVNVVSQKDKELQFQKERSNDETEKEKQDKEERARKLYKKILPDRVDRELERQIQIQKEMANEKERLKQTQEKEIENERLEKENKDIKIKTSATTTNTVTTNEFCKNDMIVETFLYKRRSDSSSRTSLPKPVRIGTMPAEYLVPGSLFLSNKEAVLVFGGVDPHHSYGIGHNTGKSVFRYIQNRRHWDMVDELPEPRHHHAVTFFKGKVYLIGGADPRGVNSNYKSDVVGSVYSFDPVSRMWAVEATLNIPRKNFGLVACSGRLYAIGGENNQERLLSSVECFCPRRKTWEEVAPLNVARMGLAATKYRDTIWVAGGFVPSKRNILSRSVECYDQRQNAWHINAPLRIPRSFTSLFVMNDTLYLVGGASNSIKDITGNRSVVSINDVDVWDDKGQEWKIHSQLSTTRHAHSVCYLGNSILVIGGVSTERMCALNDVECWNVQRGAWVGGVAELPTTLSGHGSITLPPASLL